MASALTEPPHGAQTGGCVIALGFSAYTKPDYCHAAQDMITTEIAVLPSAEQTEPSPILTHSQHRLRFFNPCWVAFKTRSALQARFPRANRTKMAIERFWPFKRRFGLLRSKQLEQYHARCMICCCSSLLLCSAL